MKSIYLALPIAALLPSALHGKETHLECIMDNKADLPVSIHMDDVRMTVYVKYGSSSAGGRLALTAEHAGFTIQPKPEGIDVPISFSQVWRISRSDLSAEMTYTRTMKKMIGQCRIVEAPPQAF